MKSWLAYKRRKQLLVFPRTGPQSFWGDPLVQMLGLHWRDARESCSSAACWMRKTSDVIQGLSDAWTLPHEALQPKPNANTKSNRPGKTELVTSPTLQDIPPLPPHLEDRQWCHHGRQFRCVVDCQVFAGFINGTTLLTNETYRPTFRRIAANLAKVDHQKSGMTQ